MFRRKPRITEEIYGRLMTSFGRAVDLDRLVAGPATALADRVCGDEQSLSSAIDGAMYRGATHYHLRLLAGAWIIAQEGNVPVATADAFEEAVAWKFEPLVKRSGAMAHRISTLARGEGERDTGQD